MESDKDGFALVIAGFMTGAHIRAAKLTSSAANHQAW